MSNPLLVTPRIREVALLPGEFAEVVERLTRDIDDARRQAGSDVRKQKAAIKLAEELDAITDDPTKVGASIVTVRGIAKRRENELLDEHPPRRNDRADTMQGYNRATFPAALTRASMVSVRTADGVHDVTDEMFDEWLDAVSPAHWDDVWEAVQYVNHGEVSVPKSSAVSVLRDLLASASTRQRGSE